MQPCGTVVQDGGAVCVFVEPSLLAIHAKSDVERHTNSKIDRIDGAASVCKEIPE